MSEDPEIVNDQVTPDQPSSGEEPSQQTDEKVSMTDLRQNLVSEEITRSLEPKKTSFFQKLTGFLRPKSQKSSPAQVLPVLTPEEPSIKKEIPSEGISSLESAPLEPGEAESIQVEGEPEAAASEIPQMPGQELDQEPESSIFDLLDQVRQSGLGEEPLTTSAFQPELSTKPLAEPPQEPQQPEEPVETPSAPTEEIMTTSSLASRLWGLEEQANQPEGEMLSAEEQAAPFIEEATEDKSAKKEETADKPGFFERLKGSRAEDRNTRTLEIDDKDFIDRVTRMTGELHEPPERKAPDQPPAPTTPQEMGSEVVDEEGGRFVFYPQETEETAAFTVAPETEAPEPSPFVSEEEKKEPSAEVPGQAVEPFTIQDEEWQFERDYEPEEETPAEVTEAPAAQEAETPVEEETGTAGSAEPTTFEKLDYLSWGGAYPQIQEEGKTPDQEGVSPQDSPDKIRAIALGSDLENLQNLDAATLAAETAEQAAASRRRRSRWRALPVFERVLIIAVVVLVVGLGAIGYLSATNFWQQPAPAVVEPTITPSTLPQPVKVVLPGAWSFTLSSSALAVTPDTPGTGIWLMGSEVRRVIELPWNKQTEAVIQTFTAGDLIQVFFADNTIMNYKVDQVLRVSASDTSILTENQPSLIIILAGEKDPERWVVVARP